MSRVRALALITLSLTAAGLSLGTSGASAASFGRCEKLVEKETGKYGSQGCQEGQIAHGNYEWLSVEKPGFTLTVESGGELGGVAVYAGSPAETTLTCTGGGGKGELSGAKAVKNVVLALAGCKSPTEGECTNTGEAGKVESNSLEGVLGIWKAEPKEQHNKIGLELFAPSYGTVFSMECGTMKTKRVVRGGIIPMLPPDTPNKMSHEFELKFMHRGTEQQPAQFEGSMSPVFEQMIGIGGWGPIGVEATVKLKHAEEEIELNTTCTC